MAGDRAVSDAARDPLPEPRMLWDGSSCLTLDGWGVDVEARRGGEVGPQLALF